MKCNFLYKCLDTRAFCRDILPLPAHFATYFERFQTHNQCIPLQENMKSLTVILVLLPVVLGGDYCLLKASFEINNRITTECKVPANLSQLEDLSPIHSLCTVPTDEEGSSELKILTAKETEFGSRGICAEDSIKTSGMFTWIKWKDFEFILRPLITHLSDEDDFVGRDISGNICRINITTATCSSDSTK